MRSAGIFAITLAGGVLCACGSDDEGSWHLPPFEVIPVRGCEQIDHAPCDISKKHCQRTRFELAACLRGSETDDPPPVMLMTEEEYASSLRESAEDDENLFVSNHLVAALSLLGLLSAEALEEEALVRETVARLGGVYRSDTKDIVIINRGASSDGWPSNAVLVHEFIHALQDRDIDLEAYRAEYVVDGDTLLAARAVSEGEARLHDSRYVASLTGLDPERVDWRQRFEESALRSLEAVIEEPFPYILSGSVVPYAYGARLVHAAWESDGLDGVDRLFASPPRSTQVLLASADGIVEEPPLADFSPPSHPEEWAPWEPQPEGTLGAWTLFLLLAKTEAIEEAQELAIAWRGDRLFVYESVPEGFQTALAWYLELSDEAGTETVHERLTTVLPDAEVSRRENRVIVLASNSGADLSWAVEPRETP